MPILRPAILTLVAFAMGAFAQRQYSDAKMQRKARVAEVAAVEKEIAAVREVYQEVSKDAAANRLVARDTVSPCQGIHVVVGTTVWLDQSGRVRLLKAWGLTEHHGDTRHYYYDRSGRLRFAYVTRAAVDGSLQEERLYLSADLRRLRHLTTLTSGPGYPFHEDVPVVDPAEWLRHPCRPAPSADQQHAG